MLDAVQARGATPLPAAEPAVWLRRVTFDLTGLPPTPAETAEFLSDPSPTAYETLVDRLNQVRPTLDKNLRAILLAPIVLLHIKIRGVRRRPHRAIKNDATLRKMLKKKAGTWSGTVLWHKNSSEVQPWLRVGSS